MVPSIFIWRPSISKTSTKSYTPLCRIGNCAWNRIPAKLLWAAPLRGLVPVLMVEIRRVRMRVSLGFVDVRM